ncbi:MAG: type II secretion system F family protein [Rhodospirillaceae bacterium]
MELPFDPSLLIVLASVVGTFMTVLAFIMPYIRVDPLALRLSISAKRRQDLRDQQLETIQQKSKLRRSKPSVLRELVEKLKLRELFASDDLRVNLLQAHWRDPNAVSIFVASRACVPIFMALVAVLMLYSSDTSPIKAEMRPVVVFIALIFGVYLPNMLMKSAIQKRQAAITLGFPDALDLLLICVESGLSIEVAFGRVAQEIGDSYPEMAEEFELTTAELAYLPDRRVALENLVMRTGLPAVKDVCTTMVQADKYGTPLTGALRTAAQENREGRLAQAEKKAGTLPATLTVPMIVFFLPALFAVILGPAIIQLTH